MSECDYVQVLTAALYWAVILCGGVYLHKLIKEGK